MTFDRIKSSVQRPDADVSHCEFCLIRRERFASAAFRMLLLCSTCLYVYVVYTFVLNMCFSFLRSFVIPLILWLAIESKQHLAKGSCASELIHGQPCCNLAVALGCIKIGEDMSKQGSWTER